LVFFLYQQNTTQIPAMSSTAAQDMYHENNVMKTSDSSSNNTHYQANYKLHDIEPPPATASITLPAVPSIKYTSYEVPNARVFTLENFLSNEECDYFMAQITKLKFESLANEYPVEYRNNERLVLVRECCCSICLFFYWKN